MNPIKVIPWDYMNQPYCPECFGKIVRTKTNEKLYQCSECGQLYAHPCHIRGSDNSVIYICLKVYFKYERLKTFIMHVAHDVKTEATSEYIKCQINDNFIEIQNNSLETTDFFQQDNIERLLKTNLTSTDFSIQQETVHLTIRKGEEENSLHGNLSMIDKIPEISILFFEMLKVLRDIIIKKQKNVVEG